MNLNTLKAFRHAIYECFTHGADALFNTIDALATETSAQSFVELSLSPYFERQWPSLYEAFEDGRIDPHRLQEVFVRYLPTPEKGKRLLLGIDASNIARPQSKTGADRTILHVPNLPHSHSAPLTVGWQFSTLVALPEQPSSWGYLLDSRRIRSEDTAGQVAATQIREIAALLPPEYRVLVVGDRYYPTVDVLAALQESAWDGLLRCKGNRVFYRAAPAPTGKRGAPRKDGVRFACQDESSQGPPDAQWEGQEEHGQRVRVERWDHLHCKQAREVDLRVYRVTRLDAAATARRPRVSWFIGLGPEPLPPAEVPTLYSCRYGIEHGYRFQKQRLLWDNPRLRTPAQFERWTQIVAVVQNLLRLARPMVAPLTQPWERTPRPATPQQVRRGLNKILGTLGTPARPVQPRGKSPGRAKGIRVPPATRFEVVKKNQQKPKKPRKSA
jgi:hypothetical protein